MAKIIILGIDGLEYDYVKGFDCKNLRQINYGRTDISEFEQPRTVVIWSSFLAGQNTEKEVLEQPVLWNFKLSKERTFFSKFEKAACIDAPGFTQIIENHQKERQALKDFFDDKISVEEFDKIAFENHEQTKQKFFEALDKDYDIVMGYFGLADVVGHLSFGIFTKMRMIYEEFDKIALKVKEKFPDATILVISDHGMKAIGQFGDHSNHGFWSLNKKIDLDQPKITDFFNLINSWD